MSKPSAAEERRAIGAISVPLVTAYLAEMGMLLTDMIIVGRLGSVELAAVGLAGDWFYVLLLIGMGVISIVSVLAAQARGAGQLDAIGSAVRQGFVAATVLSVPIMLLSWYLAPLLSLANQDPRVVAKIGEYMSSLTFCVIPVLWFTVLRNFVTAMEKTRVILGITVVALVLNALINYVLVFGKLGLPALGVFGAGLGTVIVSVLMLLALAIHVVAQSSTLGPRPFAGSWRVEPRVLKEIFLLGAPIAATQILAGGSFTVAAVLVGSISTVMLAAQQIVYTVIYLNLAFAEGLGDAARVRVAFGAGRGSPAAVKQSATISFLAGAAVCFACSLVLWLIPGTLVGLFLDTSVAANQAVLAVAIGFAILAGWFQWFCGMQIIAANALRGLKDTRTPMLAAIFGYWLIGIGGGALLAFYAELGARGVWFGMILGVVAGSSFLISGFFRRADQLSIC